ncbi:MAG: sugar ABC transporter substrate-binding protein, partial [Rhizobium sp.]|nr:sugar ABC transporter substrate-binding protein [Rhizobium sp.]
KLIAARRAAEEQYFLLSSAALEASDKTEIAFKYQIRRNLNGRREVVDAGPTTTMMPGDVLMVSMVGM